MSKANSPDRIITCFGNVLHAKRVGKGRYHLVCDRKVYGYVNHLASGWYGEAHGRGLFTNAFSDSFLGALVQLETGATKLEKLTGKEAEHEVHASRSWIANLEKTIADAI